MISSKARKKTWLKPCLNDEHPGISIFGIAVVSKLRIQVAFPEGKAAFHCSQQAYVYSEKCSKRSQLRGSGGLSPPSRASWRFLFSVGLHAVRAAKTS
jgi:hypothetical protein